MPKEHCALRLAGVPHEAHHQYGADPCPGGGGTLGFPRERRDCTPPPPPPLTSVATAAGACTFVVFPSPWSLADAPEVCSGFCEDGWTEYRVNGPRGLGAIVRVQRADDEAEDQADVEIVDLEEAFPGRAHVYAEIARLSAALWDHAHATGDGCTSCGIHIDVISDTQVSAYGPDAIRVVLGYFGIEATP